jgi:hypothetical protein
MALRCKLSSCGPYLPIRTSQRSTISCCDSSATTILHHDMHLNDGASDSNYSRTLPSITIGYTSKASHAVLPARAVDTSMPNWSVALDFA